MATLAETFLEDLEDSEDEELDNEHAVKALKTEEVIDDVEVEDIEIEELASDDEEQSKPRISSVSQLLEDKELTTHMEKLREMMKKTRKRKRTGQVLRLDDEHEIIVRSNELIILIDHHIFLSHQFVSEIYSTKLPELANMVGNPVEYAKCVMMIGDKSSEEMDALPLKRVLTAKVALMVQVTATTTLGKPLGEEELRRCNEGAEYLLSLDETKQEMIQYIHSRMDIIAPNVSAVVGAEIAAQLISLAGGIEKLSEIPACNIQVLGANKNLANTIYAHHGVIINSELVQSCPNDLKQRGLRLVANKVVLAARVDRNQDSTNNTTGQRWYAECKKKIAKWVEPPPQKPPRPLPIPDKNKARKRGGKRFRKMREKYTPTETQRMANRMGFNVAEEEIITGDGEIVGLGMLGKHNLIGGAIRTHAKPTNKTSSLHRLNNRMLSKQRRIKQRVERRGTQSGLTTSMVFTAVSGIELGNPDSLRKAKKTKYFNANDNFAKAKNT